jgi:hypothetical protein
MPDEEPTVAYSVKDLLSDISRKLDGALITLYGKADSARVDAVESRLTILENHKANYDSRNQYRQWLIPTLIAVAMLVAAIIPLVK